MDARFGTKSRCDRSKPYFPHQNKGFTLIELIVVIVILGVLGATAMPKFINMRRAALIAVLSGLEGAMRSANHLSTGAFYIQTNKTKATDDGSAGAAVYITSADGQKMAVLASTNDFSTTGILLSRADGMAAALSCKGSGKKDSGGQEIMDCNGYWALFGASKYGSAWFPQSFVSLDRVQTIDLHALFLDPSPPSGSSCVLLYSGYNYSVIGQAGNTMIRHADC